MATPKIVMCGTRVAGLHIVERLIARGVRFDHFVLLTPEQAEKARVSGYARFEALAEEHGIPVYYPESYSLTSDRDLEFFRTHRFDLLVQGGWQRLFPQEVLASLNVGAIGVHGSSDYLPKGRGRSPMVWSLIEGRRRFIMQLFLMKPGVDDGDVFAAETFDITDHDTIKTMYYKYSMIVERLIAEYLPRLMRGDFTRIPQDGVASYYPKRTPEDGHIDWEEMDVWEICNFVRAQTRPFPGAFGDIDGVPTRIWRCQVFDTRLSYRGTPYGRVVERFDDDLIVHCRGGLLLVDDHEPLT